QDRHAGTALAQLLARLDTRRNRQRHRFAREIGDLDLAAERSLGEADRYAGGERRAFALEDRMRSDVYEDVEIARRGALRSCFTLARQANPRAGIDARRDSDVESLRRIDPAFAATAAARIGDDFAATVAI